MNTSVVRKAHACEASDDEPQLTNEELRRLRRLLAVVRVDVASDTLRLETGKAKILLRPDGTVRIEGQQVTHVAQATLRLNGAIIELN